MPVNISGSGSITGLSVGGLENGIITPSELSTGGPSWDAAGNLQVSAINSGPLAGFRNAIINGDFDIWQRGTSFNTTLNVYTADRWRVVGNAKIVTRELFALGHTVVPGNPSYSLKVEYTNTSSTGPTIMQRIESVRTFSGQQVTVSFWAKSSTGHALAVSLGQNFGTGGGESATVTTAVLDTGALTSAFQKFSGTVTLPSVSGKTLGADGNDCLTLQFAPPASTLCSVEIAQVQVEAGPVATPFERRPIGLELGLCQRYYVQCIASDFDSGAAHRRYASGGGVAWAAGSTTFPVQMRVAPSYTLSGSVVYSNCSNLVPTMTTRSARAVVTPAAAGVYTWGDGTHIFDAEL